MEIELLVLGAALSLLSSELTGCSPAGFIAPGYLAICLLSAPQNALYAVAASFAVWGIVLLMDRFMILFGRRRTGVMTIVSLVLGLLVVRMGLLSPGLLGVIMPGEMASELERQGIRRTLLALAAVTAITAAAGFISRALF